MMEFERFSRRLNLGGRGFSVAEALATMFTELWQHLPENTIGHVKAVAHFPEGVLYASSTELHPAAQLRPIGSVEQHTNSLEVDLTIVLTGVVAGQIEQALQAATHRLAGDGITLIGG